MMTQQGNGKIQLTTIVKKENDQTEVEMTEYSHDIQYSVLWEEMKGWRSYFSWSEFWSGIFLGLATTVWDIGSDYLFAGKMEQSEDVWIRSDAVILSYMFISFPGLVLTVRSIQKVLTRVD